MKTAKEVFQDAAALVEDGWTQGHMARDADGDMADALGDRATCWCALGALYRALRDAIRRELRSSPYVRYFRPGNSAEGGDGVTVAWLS
jgi:hypothetical protein